MTLLWIPGPNKENPNFYVISPFFPKKDEIPAKMTEIARKWTMP